MKSRNCRTTSGTGGLVSRALDSAEPWPGASWSRSSPKLLAAFVGARNAPGFSSPPLTALREVLVVLELLRVVLVNPKARGRHRLHILRRHGDRLVGLRHLVHMVAPTPAVPGHLARQVLFERLNRSVHHRRRVAIAGVLPPWDDTRGRSV